MRKLKNNELNRISEEEYRLAPKMPIAVVLDNIRSSNNTGSVFRTSDALMIEKIYICGITGTPPNKEIHKTALDAEKIVEWEYFSKTEDAVNQLKSKGYLVYAIEQAEGSIPLPQFTPPHGEKIAVILGNEVAGVGQEVVDMCDGTVEIPQYGTKHSFNVSVCAGIVLWDLFNKLKTF